MAKIRSITLVFILLMGILPCQKGHSASIFAKLGMVLPPDHPTSKSLIAFQQEVEQLLEGQIAIQIFSDAQLGTEYEILEGLQFGNIEMGVLSSELLVCHLPLFATISMPYIFRDEEHRFRVLDGPVGIQFLNSLEQSNLIGLGFLDTSMRMLLTRHDSIKTPEGLQGKKVGVLRRDSQRDCQYTVNSIVEQSFAALGALPEPLNQQNVSNALQSEAISGLECNVTEALSLKLYKTGTMYFSSGMSYAVPDILVVSKRWFDNLSPEMQRTIRNTARKAARQQRELWGSQIQKTISELETEGVKFEATESKVFRNAVQPVYEKMYEEIGPEFEELIRIIMTVK